MITTFAIDSVQQLCEVWSAQLLAQEQALVQGQAPAKEVDVFQGVAEDTLLDANKVALDGALDEGPMAAVIGALEANAFLTNFANSHSRERRTRTQRWQRANERLLLAGRTTGVVTRQLKGIGVKPDSSFVLALNNPTIA